MTRRSASTLAWILIAHAWAFPVTATAGSTGDAGPSAGGSLEKLDPGQTIHGFSVVNLYENGTGRTVGARFISERHGFLVDFMRIESVPQGFFWVKTPPATSMGEPHACEHLLLGKGRRGRYVAALEDMSLGNSTAYTAQTRTCYHFNTIAGNETFFHLFEAKLEALLQPDFTDEEIRREVCHVGVVVDPEDSTLAVEEKGSVYTEMVSSAEKPWYHVSRPLNALVYGPEHPLSQMSGGDPAAMRRMVPEDLRRFHRSTHRLDNMGAIVSMSEDVPLEETLERLDDILHRVASASTNTDRTTWPPAANTIRVRNLPAPAPAPRGTMQATSYPSRNPSDPAYMFLQWPAGQDLTPQERTILDLFMETFAGGENSNLYKLLIDSRTRRIEPGASAVFGGVDYEVGASPGIYVIGLEAGMANEEGMARLRDLVLEDLRNLQDLEAGSDELAEFNRRFQSRLVEDRKEIEDYLNSPPMFGFRSGPAGGWLGLLERIEDTEGFRKSLVLKSAYAAAESLMGAPDNPWTERIEAWGLLDHPPYAVAAAPGPEKLEEEARARQERLEGYVEGFKTRYDLDADQPAIARYQEEFDARTTELEAIAAQDKLPGFIDNPPMTLDDQLSYQTVMLAGGVPLVASTFDNMISATAGLALRLDVVPESLLVYVPFLPSVLTEIGVVENGTPVPFEEMRERLRREVLSLEAEFDHGYEADRTEIVLTGQGGDRREFERTLAWMRTCLSSPWLDEENLPRILDLLDQLLVSQRNRMKRSEESWVDEPASGYRFQNNPLFLTTRCFLTSTHALQRLRWKLTDPEEDGARVNEVAGLLTAWKDDGREAIEARLRSLESQAGFSNPTEAGRPAASAEASTAESGDPGFGPEIEGRLRTLSPGGREAISVLARSLRACLSELPDATLPEDWNDLCLRAGRDLAAPPRAALDRIEEVLDLIRRSDNARMFIASNAADREAVRPGLDALTSSLDASRPSRRITYTDRPRVLERLRERQPGVAPVYVGLVHDGTRNGTLIFSSRHARPYDTDPEKVLDCLAGKLYGGGGPHGLFMKTWAAGLAYSNGYGYSPASGRVSYYAERCPDVSETMRFVVRQLQEAQPGEELADYTVAQVFASTRAPSRYEDRARGIARDLADELTPERVRKFREAVLAARGTAGYLDRLRSRMEAAYGPVLIGYGAPLRDSDAATLFVIGPESQFASLERYIASTEGSQTVYRLYPRDFWLVEG